MLLSLCLAGMFFFASQAVAAQSSPTPKAHSSNLTVDTTAMAAGGGSRETAARHKKNEILGKALRIPLGQDFKAYFSVEQPGGIEALREELENKTSYRAFVGVNIPL